MTFITSVRENTLVKIAVVCIVVVLVAITFGKYTPVSTGQAFAIIGSLATVGILVYNLDDSASGTPGKDAGPNQTDGDLVDSFETRKRQAKEKLDGRVRLKKNSRGEVELSVDTGEIRNLDRRLMLHVFGAWRAYEDGDRQSPKMNKGELKEWVDCSSAEADVFLSKMKNETEDFLVRHYPENSLERTELEENEIEFEMNVDEIEEIIKYIQGERRAPN
jgi:hypothetical protein